MYTPHGWKQEILPHEGHEFCYMSINAINLTAFFSKSPFSKGGFRGILNRYDKSPRPPFAKGGSLGLS